MAVNLLSLARASAGGLHNSSRGKNRSYAPGTTYGNKIAGTNIKQGAGLTNLAKKGRRGDTKIRKVAGRPAHVNATEAKAIDNLGPMGEAWVQKVGSGTVNPKTGLLEYGWFSKALNKVKKFAQGKTSLFKGGSWRPSQGKWGIFGQTSKSRARDTKKAQAKARHKSFEDFRRSYENENIAGIFTEDTEDDTPKTEEFANKYNEFIMAKSGLNTPGGFIDNTQIQDYTDEYDTRKEEELVAETELGEQKLDLTEKTAFTSDITGQQATGASLQTGLFGLLTQSQDTTATQNFAGAGDFAAKFKEKQILEEAERANNAGKTERELTLEETDINRQQLEADTVSGITDLQDDYNQEFWNSMVSWDTAINS